MSQPDPSIDLVAALDGPFVFARSRFREYAPTVAVGILVGLIPNIPSVFLASSLQATLAQGGADMIPTLLLAYLIPILSFFFWALGFAIEAACIANILGGRGASLSEALGQLKSGRFWAAYAVAGFFSVIASAFCCFGGALVMFPFGLMLPAIYDEKRGFDALSRSVQLSFQQTGPGVFDRPGWKTVAVFGTAVAVAMAFAQAASIPIYASMMTRMFEAIKSGNIQDLQQFASVDPWISLVVQLLVGASRVFTDTYSFAGAFLIFRAARNRLDGSDMESAIDASAIDESATGAAPLA